MNCRKKIKLIMSISIFGMIIGILIYFFKKESFLFLKEDRFMDYFNTLKVTNDVYSTVGIGRGYFPFTYVLMIALNFIFKFNILGYIITYIIFITILIFFGIKNLSRIKKNILYIVLLIISSYPILFTFDRGNTEYLVMSFLLIFFLEYKKRNYNNAAILLAFPICMKLYPAIFIILFLKEKKYKEFILCIIYTTLVMIGSFIVIGGNKSNIHIALQNFNFFTDLCAKTEYGVQYSHTLWSMSNFINIIVKDSLLNSVYINIYTIIIIILALSLLLYILFIEKKEWKIITILTIMMITFPHVSFDYTLIHMYIPIIYFIISNDTKNWENILYSFLFGLTIIPMNWLQTTLNNNIVINIGLLIRPLILINIIVIIIISNFIEKSKKVEKKHENRKRNKKCVN